MVELSMMLPIVSVIGPECIALANIYNDCGSQMKGTPNIFKA